MEFDLVELARGIALLRELDDQVIGGTSATDVPGIVEALFPNQEEGEAAYRAAGLALFVELAKLASSRTSSKTTTTTSPRSAAPPQPATPANCTEFRP